MEKKSLRPLVFLGLATALAIVDSTIVNVALPTISRHLHLSLSGAEWVVSGYGITLAALLVTMGRLGDRWGRRRILLWGVTAFVTASALCAAAQTGPELITARVVQGASAAAILPLVLSIIQATYTGPQRGAAFTVYGAIIATMAALGPLLGSLLLTVASWPAAFLVNLPVGLVVVLGLRRTLPRELDARPATPAGADVVGQGLLLLGLVTLLFGLVEAPRYGWWAPRTELFGWPADRPVGLPALALLGAAVVLSAFVAVERRRVARSRPSLVDLSLLQIRSFRIGVFATSVVALGEFGIIFLLPLYLQVARGLSPLHGQLVLLPIAVGSFAATPLRRVLSGWTLRRFVRVGLALEILGLASLAALLTPHVRLWLLAPALLVYGAGVSFAIGQLSSAVLADVPVTRIGQASGISSTARQIGSAAGVAVLTAVATSVLSLTLSDRIAHRAPALPAVARTQVATAVAASPADPGAVAGAFRLVPPAQLRPVQAAAADQLSLGVRVAGLAAVLPIAVAFVLCRGLSTSTTFGGAPTPRPRAVGAKA